MVKPSSNNYLRYPSPLCVNAASNALVTAVIHLLQINKHKHRQGWAVPKNGDMRRLVVTLKILFRPAGAMIQVSSGIIESSMAAIWIKTM